MSAKPLELRHDLIVTAQDQDRMAARLAMVPNMGLIEIQRQAKAA